MLQTCFQRQFQRIIHFHISQQAKSLIKQRAQRILLRFLLIDHRNIIRMTIFIQKKGIDFQHRSQITAKIFKLCDLLDLFSQILNPFRNLRKSRQFYCQALTCISSVQFFQRNQNFALFQKIPADTAPYHLTFVFDLNWLICYKRIGQTAFPEK